MIKIFGEIYISYIATNENKAFNSKDLIDKSRNSKIKM